MPHASDNATRVRRLIVSTDLDPAIQRLIAELRRESGSAVDFSTMTRVLWAIALASQNELAAASRTNHVGTRPRNSKSEHRSEYEKRWAELIRLGLHEALHARKASVDD